VLAAAAVLGISAGPAAAEQALRLGKGPPLLTGDFDGTGAFVIHCNALSETTPGVVVLGPTGERRGGNCPGSGF
jgi:hypothetical protein